MATERSLGTLLRVLQNPSSEGDLSRLLASATTLLTLLHNPLNVTLLTSHLLSAPAIWQNPNGLATSLQILSCFSAASRNLLGNEQSNPATGSHTGREESRQVEWLEAVVKGANEKSPRWRHLLMLGGLLLGFHGHDGLGLSLAYRRRLSEAIVKATNLALTEVEFGSEADKELIAGSLLVTLSRVFDVLDDFDRTQLDHDNILPIFIDCLFFSPSGLQWGYFLGTMDKDVVQSAGDKFAWSIASSTYIQMQKLASGPILATMGSNARMIAYCIDHITNAGLLPMLLDDILKFTRSLAVQWRQNKLSELDIADEDAFLEEKTLKTSLPLLWQVLKSTMFASITILRAVLCRILGDQVGPHGDVPLIAIQALHIQRNLYFISSRLGQNAFSQLTFTFLIAVDMISRYPIQAEAFLREIRSTDCDHIPQHPLDRCHDLFFLNSAENLALALSPETNDNLLVRACLPYIGSTGDPRLLEVFEAAHSVMLAVLAAPQDDQLASKYLPLYVDNLLRAFPANLSSRQFRTAIRILTRIASPPSAIAEAQPLFASTLLEIVRDRAHHASGETIKHNASIEEDKDTPNLSEQTVMILTLIDSLPSLPVSMLEEWLDLTADTLTIVQNEQQLHICRQRLWEVLHDGEMDLARSPVCVEWWHTKGGKQRIMFDFQSPQHQHQHLMTGGLGEASKL